MDSAASGTGRDGGAIEETGGGPKRAYWMATRTEPPVKLPLVAVTRIAVGA